MCNRGVQVRGPRYCALCDGLRESRRLSKEHKGLLSESRHLRYKGGRHMGCVRNA